MPQDAKIMRKKHGCHNQTKHNPAKRFGDVVPLSVQVVLDVVRQSVHFEKIDTRDAWSMKLGHSGTTCHCVTLM